MLAGRRVWGGSERRHLKADLRLCTRIFFFFAVAEEARPNLCSELNADGVDYGDISIDIRLSFCLDIIFKDSLMA